eukprot:g172.t1
MSCPVPVVGVDIGSSSCVLARPNGSLLTNDMGSQSTQPMIAFLKETKVRALGDAAAAQAASNATGTVTDVLSLVREGTSRDLAGASYTPAQLLGMLLVHLGKCAVNDSVTIEPAGAPTRAWALAVPLDFDAAQRAGVFDAARIAGLPAPAVVGADDALANAYFRSVRSALAAEAKAAREADKQAAAAGAWTRTALVIDVGHAACAATVAHAAVGAVRNASALGSAAEHGAGVGAVHNAVLARFVEEAASGACKGAGGAKIDRAAMAPNTRGEMRLRAGAAKLVTTLSSIESSNVTVENVGGVDSLTFALARATLEEQCGDVLARVGAAVRRAAEAARGAAREAVVAAQEKKSEADTAASAAADALAAAEAAAKQAKEAAAEESEEKGETGVSEEVTQDVEKKDGEQEQEQEQEQDKKLAEEREAQKARAAAADAQVVRARAVADAAAAAAAAAAGEAAAAAAALVGPVAAGDDEAATPALRLHAVELVGGGTRMPCVKAAVREAVTVLLADGVAVLEGADGGAGGGAVSLGSHLDSASAVATGAAMCGEQFLSAAVADATSAAHLAGGHAMGDSALADALGAEAALAARDALAAGLAEDRNALEATILSYRAVATRPTECGRPLAATALSAEARGELGKAVDEAEAWLWGDEAYACEATAADGGAELMAAKRKALDEAVAALAAPLLEAEAAAKAEAEAKLEADAKAEAERRAAEGDDDDHDRRKLPVAERVRMAQSNKAEGTELFKGGNYRHAAARYNKALTHLAKCFDCSPEQRKEVDALKLALNGNMALAYQKMENWDKVLAHADDCLKLDAENAKALFRRATAWDKKGEVQKAAADVKKAAALAPDDKAIKKLQERVRKLQARQKEKERKMAARMFA